MVELWEIQDAIGPKASEYSAETLARIVADEILKAGKAYPTASRFVFLDTLGHLLIHEADAIRRDHFGDDNA